MGRADTSAKVAVLARCVVVAMELLSRRGAAAAGQARRGPRLRQLAAASRPAAAHDRRITGAPLRIMIERSSSRTLCRANPTGGRCRAGEWDVTVIWAAEPTRRYLGPPARRSQCG